MGHTRRKSITTFRASHYREVHLGERQRRRSRSVHLTLSRRNSYSGSRYYDGPDSHSHIVPPMLYYGSRDSHRHIAPLELRYGFVMSQQQLHTYCLQVYPSYARINERMNRLQEQRDKVRQMSKDFGAKPWASWAEKRLAGREFKDLLENLDDEVEDLEAEMRGIRDAFRTGGEAVRSGLSLFD